MLRLLYYTFQILIGLSILVLIYGCSGTRKTSLFHKKDELLLLSEKLPVPVESKDNLKLYKLIADWYGTPHKDGGCEKTGTDCSCFIKMLATEVYGKTLPRNSFDMFKLTSRIDSTELKEGDLVFFNTKSDRVSHVGMYLKDKKFAHVSSSKGVIINSLTENYYRRYYAGAGKLN